jgi:hypothetical protein
MNPLHDALRLKVWTTLTEQYSSEARSALADWVLLQGKDISFWLTLAFLSDKGGVRFSWLMGDLLRRSVDFVAPAIPFYLEHRNPERDDAFDRALAKMLTVCPIPEALQGQVADVAWDWCTSAEYPIATRNFAFDILYKLSKVYPELARELRLEMDPRISFEPGTLPKKYHQLFVKGANKGRKYGAS